LIALLPLGCGKSGFIKAKGRIVKGGQPYIAPEGEGFRIFFVPANMPEGSHFDSYAAECDPDNGSFQVRGKDGEGLPAGKYRIDLQLMQNKEDLLGGGLLGKKSPFTCEVPGVEDDIVIDLDKSKFDSLLAQASAPKKGGTQGRAPIKGKLR